MTESPIPLEDVVQQLAERRHDAAMTLEHLGMLEAKIGEERAALENPQAVLEYLAFFADFIGRAVAACDRVSAEVAGGVHAGHVAALREIASNSAAEQRRCLQFRDRCINRPLPHERMRPLLNDISVTTRDQLTAFRDLARAADRLEQLLAAHPAPPEPPRVLDRRALFTRLIRRGGTG